MVVKLGLVPQSGVPLSDTEPLRNRPTIFLRALVQSPSMDLKAVIEDFAGHIVSLLEAQATEKAKAEILGAFGMGAPRKPGRPPKAAVAVITVATPVAAKVRKKMPPQYCPVPYCRNVAAPIFGMVCAKHKGVSKAKIKQYREERHAKKEGVKPAKKKPAKRAKRVAKKTTRAAPAAKKKVQAKRVAKKVTKRVPKKAKAPVSTPAPSAAPATAATPI